MSDDKKSQQEIDKEERHKDKKTVKEKLEDHQDKQNENIGFKQWLTKTIIIGFLLLGIVYAVEHFFHIEILTHTILAITIVLAMGFTHEAIHYFKAIKLGYKPVWFRTRFTMGFEIEDNPNLGLREKHRKQIGFAPYPIILPLSIITLIIGLYMNNLGLIIAGITSTVLHIITLPFEGRT